VQDLLLVKVSEANPQLAKQADAEGCLQVVMNYIELFHY